VVEPDWRCNLDVGRCQLPTYVTVVPLLINSYRHAPTVTGPSPIHNHTGFGFGFCCTYGLAAVGKAVEIGFWGWCVGWLDYVVTLIVVHTRFTPDTLRYVAH